MPLRPARRDTRGGGVGRGAGREGAATLLFMGRRLKVPGRGWCAANLDGMAALIATIATPEWDDLWTRPAA